MPQKNVDTLPCFSLFQVEEHLKKILKKNYCSGSKELYNETIITELEGNDFSIPNTVIDIENFFSVSMGDYEILPTTTIGDCINTLRRILEEAGRLL